MLLTNWVPPLPRKIKHWCELDGLIRFRGTDLDGKSILSAVLVARLLPAMHIFRLMEENVIVSNTRLGV
jgi:hypothetical protein